MLKLTTSISKKIGMPDYGSRGAAVSLEVELDTCLIDDPATLSERIRHAFDIARQEVDAELAKSNGANGGDNHRDHRPQPTVSGRSTGGNGEVRLATSSQVRAIRAISARRRLDADEFANKRFGVNGLDELTLKEASAVIDELKEAQRGVGSGGDR